MSDKIRRRQHGGDVWGFSKKYKVPVENIIDFSAPINPFGSPQKALEKIKKFASFIKFYPDQNPGEFKRSIADYVKGISSDNVVIGNGSIELIYMFFELFARNYEVIIHVPSFTEYEKAALRVDAKPVLVKMPEDFSLKPDAIKNAVTKDTRMLLVCNPHSPSGRLFNRDLILELTDFCYARDIQVMVDENYMDFISSCQEYTLAPYVSKYDNLFIVRSFSKFFGMPGLRIGYGIGASKLIYSLENFRMPWSTSHLALIAAQAALEDTKFIEKSKKYLGKEKEKLVDMLSRISALKVFPSETNFLLIKILDKSINAIELKEKLAGKGILIRSCEDFQGLDETYFRISIRKRKENLLLVQALETIFR